MSTGGCGRSQSCFRACGFRPRCDAPESVYMLTMRPDLEREEITFRLGGILRDNRSYTAVGFGLDKNDLRNMDFVACTREGEEGERITLFFSNSSFLNKKRQLFFFYPQFQILVLYKKISIYVLVRPWKVGRKESADFI